MSTVLPTRAPSFATLASNEAFPPDFVWGVATAATQIEGAATEEGKGDSVWDAFSRKPGAIARGETPAVACDHYHRYLEDFDLMAKMGIRHYRLSLAWPRIIPEGRGSLNEAGLAFYDRLIDALLARKITPWVTMFHWDLPQALEEMGGWRSRIVPEAFAAYADTIVKRYGDRVKNWITLNEIHCFTGMAYGLGRMAPGAREDPAVVAQTYHHALLCHGLGVRAVREHGGPGARVGLTDNAHVFVPYLENEACIRAAETAFTRDSQRILWPVFKGAYSDEFLAAEGAKAPKFQRDDLALISLPTDFLGFNIYTATQVREGADGQPEVIPYPRHHPRADSSWLLHAARCCYWGPRFAASVYGARDIVITENGAGYTDDEVKNGEVQDLHRIEYLRACLRELRRGIADGVPVKGYFLWSFMDNFEWADGYDIRFGLVHVDYKSLKRTPKLSASWYSAVLGENRIL